MLNAAFTVLSSVYDFGTESGAIGPIAVNPGDVIGFRVATGTGTLGEGRLTISDFSAPDVAAVPEPSTLSLLAVAMAALLLAGVRRRGTPN
ncbi:MAG: PEP-CTERM sorting domain-containing protein [bacterium]|nr:PEP-CTERM sorting domain-containing protein [bacterium]